MLGLAGYSVLAAPVGDAVQSLPGFGDLSSLPFKVYSGYLTVPCDTGLEPQSLTLTLILTRATQGSNPEA